MKKILVASLLIIVSCKKETKTTPAPTTPPCNNPSGLYGKYKCVGWKGFKERGLDTAEFNDHNKDSSVVSFYGGFSGAGIPEKWYGKKSCDNTFKFYQDYYGKFTYRSMRFRNDTLIDSFINGGVYSAVRFYLEIK